RCASELQGGGRVVEPSRCKASSVWLFAGRLDGTPHFLWRAGWIDLANPQWRQRVEHRVDDGGRRADGRTFTYALDAQRVDRAGRDRAIQRKAGQIERRRHHVGRQVTGQERTFVPEYLLLVKGLRDTLRQAAVHLALDQQRVEHAATVIDRDISPQRHRTGLRIDVDNGNVRSKGKDQAGRLEIPGGFQAGLHVGRPGAAVGSLRDRRKRDGAAGDAADLPLSIIHDDVGRC